MSKIRLKCDVCGGTFQDQYTKIICSYCERKEMQLNEKEKKELIADFLQKLKEKDNKIDCKYRCADEPCEYCTNYCVCEDCNYIIIKEYQKKLKEGEAGKT